MPIPVMPIPAFEAPGLLPPYVGDPRHPVGHSPYRVSLVEVVRRFGGTAERRAILDGYLQFRAAVHRAGFVEGFQWLDGSFTEEIERLEDRSPGDVDVVTFVQPAAPITDAAIIRPLVFPASKDTYHCDSYLVDLTRGGRPLVRNATYWSGLFGHRRNRGPWKGMLEVDLAPIEDAAARATLTEVQGVLA